MTSWSPPSAFNYHPNPTSHFFVESSVPGFSPHPQKYHSISASDERSADVSIPFLCFVYACDAWIYVHYPYVIYYYDVYVCVYLQYPHVNCYVYVLYELHMCSFSGIWFTASVACVVVFPYSVKRIHIGVLSFNFWISSILCVRQLYSVAWKWLSECTKIRSVLKFITPSFRHIHTRTHKKSRNVWKICECQDLLFAC